MSNNTVPKPKLTTYSPQFFSRKARTKELADFGAVVLQILTNVEEWDADTIDAIAGEAIDRWLAGVSPKTGLFKSIVVSA